MGFLQSIQNWWNNLFHPHPTPVPPPPPTVPVVLGAQEGSAIWAFPTADITQTLQTAKAMGATSFRIEIAWANIEGIHGQYYWAAFDTMVDRIIAAGMTVLGVLDTCPPWANLSVPYNEWAPPKNSADFAAFCGIAAQHFTGKITTWEIWNEPNIAAFWATGPDAGAYTYLLVNAYKAIKAVQPAATVIVGGPSPAGIPFATWVQQMYAAGAAGHFDAMALHPYAMPSLPSAGILSQVSAVHSLMVQNGDAGKKIWFTECGAPTGSALDAVSQASQAQAFQELFAYAKANSFTGPIYPYCVRDMGTDPADDQQNFGVVTYSYAPKQAYAAITAVNM